MYDDWSSMTWGGKALSISVAVTGYLTLAGWVAEEATKAELYNENFLHVGGGIAVKTSKRPRADGRTYYTVYSINTPQTLLYIGADLDEAKAAITAAPRVDAEFKVEVLFKYVERQWHGETAPERIKLSLILDGVPSSKWEATYVAAAEEEIAKVQ